MIVNQKIEEALNNKKPVVLIETAFIAGCQEKTFNLKDINNIETAVEQEGAIPAFVGVIDGEIVVGLDRQEIELLMYKEDVVKSCGLTKISYLQVNKLSGGVNNVLMFYVAKHLNVPFTVTGGIGGVSRINNFDISADLNFLAKSPILCFCCGPKSMLDIRLTREVLETYGVSVCGYKTDKMPSFYSNESNCKNDWIANSPEEIANVFINNQKLGIENGIMIGIPVSENESVPYQKVEQTIKTILSNNEIKSDGQLFGQLIQELKKENVFDSSLGAETFIISAKIAAQVAVEYIKNTNKEEL